MPDVPPSADILTEGARVEKRAGKWRVLDTKTGKIKVDKNGAVMDGGGYDWETAARAKASAINSYGWKR